MNIANGKFEFVRGGNAVGFGTVVDEACVVPAKDVVSFSIPVRVFAKDIPVEGFHGVDLLSRKKTIEPVKNPGNSTLGDSAGSYNAITDRVIDKADFSMRMDHADSCC
jgi:hypothetical protein